jgi:hypothetical protein
MRKSATSTSTQLSLLRGQTHGEQLQRGTVIRVISGTVKVHSRVWLAHSSWAASAPVCESGGYFVQASGWFELVAQSDVHVSFESPGNTFLLAVKTSWASLPTLARRNTQERLMSCT